MNGIAIYYEGTCIYWSSIIIAAGIITGFFLSLAFFTTQNKFAIGYCFYFVNIVVFGLLLSRYLYWFCNKEQFESLEEAFVSFEKGGYLIPGMIVAAILTAVIFRVACIVKNINYLLDPLAIGLAFMIGIFKFSCIFSDVCQGKLFVTLPLLQGLPFAVETIDVNGNVQYRLATFYLTFICMMIITVTLLCVWVAKKNEPNGHIFRLFLYMYALVEIIMDSTRYDAAHPTFDGEAFEGLNKASGFMGLGQLFGAVSLIYVFTYYMVKNVKKDGWKAKNIISLVLFVVGFATAGASEYLVQRFTSMMVGFYGLMLIGLIIIAISLGVLQLRGKTPLLLKINNSKYKFYKNNTDIL